MCDRVWGAPLQAALLGGSFSPAETSPAPLRGALPFSRPPGDVCPFHQFSPPEARTAASGLDAREGSSARKCPAGVERLTPLRAKTRRPR